MDDVTPPAPPPRKGILIVPPRPPPPTQPIRVEQLEEVGRKGITIQAMPLPTNRPSKGGAAGTSGRDIEEQSDRGGSLDSRTAPSLGDGGEGGGVGGTTEKQIMTSGRMQYLFLGFGIILGLIGATLLVALGVLYVKPYIKVRDMKVTECTVASTVLAEELVTCACASDGSQSCLSHYPCLKLWVNYNTLDGHSMANITLYDSYDTFILQHEVLKCSFHKCSRQAASNLEAVQRWTQEHGDPGTKFPCYYAPHNPDYAILEVISLTLVVHCMFWPALGLIIGVSILFMHICGGSSGGGNSPRSSPFNSLERPWLRYADRNYEKVGTLVENYNS